MLFNSIEFLLFFPIVVLLYYLIPKKAGKVWLLITSYFFYMCWNAAYAILILISTVVTYGAALLMNRTDSKSAKKGFLIGNLVINFGILFFFKYFEFFLMNISFFVKLFGGDAIKNPFSLLLPVGISFYTFQAVGYAIDVYRGDLKSEKNFVTYALFVSFFPQLVAGPVERAKNLLPQIKDMSFIRKASYNDVVSGLCDMVWGLFLKMVIADRIALFVDGVFANTYKLGTIETVLGAIAFAIQIYCDFGGYSAIAIGAAKVLGVELMKNFDTPYFAESIAEFWHRWHISLSTWFKDYVYIPLGGNRCSKAKKYRNLLITFLVSGLWHGASWTYVLWGGLHGLYQIVEDLLKNTFGNIRAALKINKDTFGYHLAAKIRTFLFVSFAWIFFRAESVSQAFLYIRRMITRFNPWVLYNESLFKFGLDRTETWILMIAIAVLLLVDIAQYKTKKTPGELLLKENVPFRWIAVIVLVLIVLVYGEYGINFDSGKFIYFDF
ncbi:MAG: MBOAT family protein [Lachnospiraceae bacterium]|nr:MBOAT family protein [Lachnospiraceae bacterium]